MIPGGGRKKEASAEFSDEAIARTQEYLKEKAKGATFFISRDGETVRAPACSSLHFQRSAHSQSMAPLNDPWPSAAQCNHGP
jgi:hypothetical protein